MKEKNNNIECSTSGNSISIRNYFKELRKLDTISSDEQMKLVVKAKSGDQRALNKLVESNLRFVVSVAKEYSWSGIPLEELSNEGNLGLIKAVSKFDETKEIKFISYAVWWVRQSIMQSVYDNGKAVRLPINKINNTSKINKASEKLYHKLDREPTVEELVEATELTEKEVKISVNNAMSYVSLDLKVSEDSDSDIGDFIAGETMEDIDREVNISSLRQEINSVFEGLSEREIIILNMHFGLNGYYEMSLKEIGEELGLTNERVRQIKEFSLKKLRMYGKSSKLKEFLECKL